MILLTLIIMSSSTATTMATLLFGDLHQIEGYILSLTFMKGILINSEKLLIKKSFLVGLIKWCTGQILKS